MCKRSATKRNPFGAETNLLVIVVECEFADFQMGRNVFQGSAMCRIVQFR